MLVLKRCGVYVGSLFYGVVLGAISACRGRESWLLYFNCVVAHCVLYLFLVVPWVGLHYVNVAFPGN